MVVVLTPEQYAAKVLDLVRDDMRRGVVPDEVSSFAELHDHVDANGYLSDAGVPFGTDAGSGEDGSGMVNAVCEIVSRVLAAGLHWESARDGFALCGAVLTLGNEAEGVGDVTCEECAERLHVLYGGPEWD